MLLAFAAVYLLLILNGKRVNRHRIVAEKPLPASDR